jgi:cytochrome c oxidase assembly factor CtaG
VADRRLFVLGMAMVVGAGVGPLPESARHSLAAHMSEHIALLLVAPLFLALGVRAPVWTSWQRWGVALVGVLAAHTLVMVAWHLPGPFDAATRNEPLHALEHVSMLGSGFLFWWVVFGAPSRGVTAPALFVAGLPGSALGAAMTLSTTPWYGATPSLPGQQLAGVVMWAFGGAVYVIAAAVAFGVWLANLDRRSESVYVRTTG